MNYLLICFASLDRAPLSIPWLVTVYCKSAVMTCFLNDGISIRVPLQIVSIFQTHIDSGWGSCFSCLSMCDIWEKSLLLIQFSNHLHVRALLTLTCFSEGSTRISALIFREKTMWVHVSQGGYMVIHFSGMCPLENLCCSRLVCILIWTPQPDPYFNMTAKGLFPHFFSWALISKEITV